MNSVNCIAQRFLHRQPVSGVHVLLVIGVDLQEEEVPDEVGLREALAFRVEALEHEVGIIIRAERDAHDGKPFDDDSLQGFEVDPRGPKLALQEGIGGTDAARRDRPRLLDELQERRTIGLCGEQLDVSRPPS